MHMCSARLEKNIRQFHFCNDFKTGPGKQNFVGWYTDLLQINGSTVQMLSFVFQPITSSSILASHFMSHVHRKAMTRLI